MRVDFVVKRPRDAKLSLERYEPRSLEKNARLAFRAWERNFLGFLGCSDTVSYTHLTLQTILRV